MEAARTDRGRRSSGVPELVTGRDTVTPWWMVVSAAGLLFAVAVIHLQDQGGLLGSESPTYLKWGYYLVELLSMLSAVLLLRGRLVGWFLGLGVTALPFIGYILTRTTGLPQDSGDEGNWGYLLGTVSLVVEGTFVLLAVIALSRIVRQRSASLATASAAG
jgi:hypothetical protein